MDKLDEFRPPKHLESNKLDSPRNLENAMKHVTFISAMVYELIPVREGKISVDDAIKFNRFWADFTRNAQYISEDRPKRDSRIIASIALLLSLAAFGMAIYRVMV